MARSNTLNPSGFTLLEILVAMAILSIVLSLIYASFTKTLTEIKEVEMEADVYQMARISLERIQEDLECALILKKEEDTEVKEESHGTVEFEGVDEQIDQRDADSLMFFSTNHISLDQENEYAGLARIAFSVIKNEEEEGFTLYRSDNPEFENASEEKTNGQILCDRLFSVNFTYYTAEGDEYNQWNSSEGALKGKLPARVLIQLSFINEEYPDEPLKFETAVALPMASDTYGEES